MKHPYRPMLSPRRAPRLRRVLTAVGHLLVLLLFVLSLTTLWYNVKRFSQHNLLPLKRLVVDAPLQHSDGEILRTIVQKQAHLDLLKINIHRIAEEVAALDWVEAVEVKRLWSDALWFSIRERTPVLRWGAEDYLDGEGKRFRIWGTPQDLPLVIAPDGHELRVLRYAQLILPWLQSQNVPVSALQLDNQLQWHVLIGDVDVVLGREDLVKRLQALVLTYRSLIKPYQAFIEKVDLRYKNYGASVLRKKGARIKMPNTVSMVE